VSAKLKQQSTYPDRYQSCTHRLRNPNQPCKFSCLRIWGMLRLHSLCLSHLDSERRHHTWPLINNTIISSSLYIILYSPWQMLDIHNPLVQSEWTLHTLLSVHCGHVEPPQSTSVSSPFRILSTQVAAEKVRRFRSLSHKERHQPWQTLDAHTPLTQSEWTLQRFVSMH
jgi:hypothetical protein